jgi:benzoyl-CoA-dihydrodiol lyase
MFALVEPGSCFAGTLLELALAADRAYMLRLTDEPERAPRIAVSRQNFGAYPMVSGQSRLARRFCDGEGELAAVASRIGNLLSAEEATTLGLVTSAPDDIDWDDEIRIAIEERASMSPDALTGLEANLRFGGRETMATRIFGRLSAWQNWIFNRPNAVGEAGALKVYGSGSKAKFNWERV